MYTYWFLFFFITIIGSIGCHFKANEQRYILAILLIVMTSFQGFRWNTGADWFQFWWYFDNASWDIFSFMRWDEYRILEPGYAFLNILIKTVYNSYTLFLLITCAFINYSYLRVVKMLAPTKYVTLIYAIVLLSAPVFPVRQQFAAAIFLWGIPYIIGKDLKKYLIVVAVATSVHFSSIILLPFYWVDKNIKWWVLSLTYMMTPFFVTYLPLILNPFQQLMNIFAPSSSALLFNQYINGYGMTNANIESGESVLSLYSLLSITVFGYIKDKFFVKSAKKYANVLLNLYVLGAIGLLIGNLPGFNEFRRLSYYSFINIGLLTGLMFSISKKRFDLYLRNIVLAFAIILTINAYYKWLNSSYSPLYIPYYSIFESEKHGIRDL